MRYEILDSLPSYGPMYVSVTESDQPFYSEGFVVRFYKSDASEWVANFEPGWTGFKAVYTLKDTDNILVIAMGTCYLMNPDRELPIAAFGIDYENAFILADGRILLQGQTALTIIEADGSYWLTPRISWDGIKELSIHGSSITGLALGLRYDWVDFTYDIDSKKLIGGSFSNE